MKQIKTYSCPLLITSMLFLFSCTETTTTPEANDKDTPPVVSVNKDTVTMPAYDPAMDAYNVGGEAVKKMGDTLGVKMYEFTARPGDSANLHTHPDHAVYVLQGGKIAVTFQGMGRQILDLKTGTGFINGSVSDAGKNIGNTTVKLLIVDIYRPRSK